MTTPVLIQPRHDVFPNNAIVEIRDDPADIGPA